MKTQSKPFINILSSMGILNCFTYISNTLKTKRLPILEAVNVMETITREINI